MKKVENEIQYEALKKKLAVLNREIVEAEAGLYQGDSRVREVYLKTMRESAKEVEELIQAWDNREVNSMEYSLLITLMEYLILNAPSFEQTLSEYEEPFEDGRSRSLEYDRIIGVMRGLYPVAKFENEEEAKVFLKSLRKATLLFEGALSRIINMNAFRRGRGE